MISFLCKCFLLLNILPSVGAAVDVVVVNVGVVAANVVVVAVVDVVMESNSVVVSDAIKTKRN